MSKDRATFVNFLISEIIQNCRSFEIQKALHIIHITDCKSLYDCIYSSHPSTAEKRTIVDIRSLQQYVSHDTQPWVPTQHVYADCPTKISKQLMTTFHGWLQEPTLIVRAISIDQGKNWECEFVSILVGHVSFTPSPQHAEPRFQQQKGRPLLTRLHWHVD